MWKQEKKYKNLDFRKGTTFQVTHKKKTDTHGKPKAIILPQVLKDTAQLETIRSDLLKCHKSDSASPHTIATLLEASYYERICKLRSPSDGYNFKDYLKQYPILTNIQWLYYEWRLVKAYLKE